MPEKILTVEDLEIKFELRGKTLHAIRGISMELHRGEILAIVGESGSGKSVFTKSFMGLDVYKRQRYRHAGLRACDGGDGSVAVS